MPTPSRERLAVALCVLAVVALLPAAWSVPAAGSTGSAEPSFSSAHFLITVHADGSARWTFRYRTPLENETERQHFREFAREFEENRTDRYVSFQRKARQLVADGENVSGRPMAAQNFSRRAAVTGLDDNLGVVEMSFTWTNFARTRDDRVVVGDLFDGGLYLGADQRLVFRAGPGLRFVSVSPDPAATSGTTLAESDSVTWTGQRDFTDEHPRLVLANASAVATSTDTTVAGSDGDGPTGGTSATGGRDAGLGAWVWFIVGVLLTGLVAAAVLLWRRNDNLFPDRASSESEAADVSDDAPSAPGPEEGGESEASAAGARQPSVSDEEMLTDEERVTRLLEEHGGRMRQVNIVEETDWSKSKVSMLLSEMEAEGEITRLRVGRENVVTLPGHEPDAAGGPDEERDEE